MPLFFLLAGFFYRPQNIRFGALLIQKLKTRIIPVVFFDCITLPLWKMPWLWNIKNVDPDTAYLNLWNLFQGIPNLNWPCWFLISLFLIELVASELIPSLPSIAKRLLAIFVIYFICRFATENIGSTAQTLGVSQLWWFLLESPMGLFFYMLGYMAASYPSITPQKTMPKFFIATTAFAAWIFSTGRTFESAAHVNMSAAEYGSWLFFPIAAITGILFFYHICQKIPAMKILEYIGNNTLPLLGMNGFFLHFFNMHIFTFCSAQAKGFSLLALTLAAATISLLACLPLIALLNRFTPLLIGKWR